MEIHLTPETVKLYKAMICKPNEFNIDILPISEVLVKTDKVIPADILYEQYNDYISPRYLPKIMFYIIMRDEYGDPVVDPNSKNKNAGYFLEVKKELQIKTCRYRFISPAGKMHCKMDIERGTSSAITEESCILCKGK